MADQQNAAPSNASPTSISTVARAAAASANTIASITTDGVIDPALYVPHDVRQQQRRPIASFDGDDSINVIEEGDHVGTEDFGLSSAEISMQAPFVAIDSLNTMQQIEALLGMRPPQKVPPQSVQHCTEAQTENAATKATSDNQQPVHTAVNERAADTAARLVATAIHIDSKVTQLQSHPLVASIATDGCSVQCKCGKLVRLNPAWYIIKFEQHIVSRSCTYLRKKKPKRVKGSTATRPDQQHQRMDQSTETAAATAKSDVESMLDRERGGETRDDASATSTTSTASAEEDTSEANEDDEYSLKDADTLLQLHTTTDACMVQNGSVRGESATETQDSNPIVVTLRELKANPHFSRMTPDGRFIECTCSALVILSTPWDAREFHRHVRAKSDPSKTQRKRFDSRQGRRRGDGAAYRIEQRLLPRETRWQPVSRGSELPCPGLREDRITMFINSTTKTTGGCRARRRIAEELFPHHFASKAKGKRSRPKLTPEEKQILYDAMEGEALWFIDRDANSVRSLDCRGSMAASKGEECCFSCRELRSNVSLKVSIAVASGQQRTTDEASQDPSAPPFKLSSACKFALLEQEFDIKQEHARLLRDLFRVDVDESSVKNLWFDMAELGMSGAFASHPAFLGVLESMLMLKDKQRRGVGLQNMQYNEHLDAFMKSLSDISVKACEHFQSHLGGRNPKSLLVKKRRLNSGVTAGTQAHVHPSSDGVALANTSTATDSFTALPFDLNAASGLTVTDVDLASFHTDATSEHIHGDDGDQTSATELGGGETTDAFLTDENMDEQQDQETENEASAVAQPPPPVIVPGYMPCRGLRDEKVQAYVTTSTQVIGGSRPKYVIAKELFPEVFSGAKSVKMQEKLDDTQRLTLQDAIFSECLWRVDRLGNCVRSLRCYRIVDKRRGDGICRACLSLKSITNFRSLLCRAKVPKKVENIKYVPSMYTESDPFMRKLSKNASLRSLYQMVKREIADDSARKRVVFWLRLAKMGLFGHFRTHAVFAGLVGSMVELKDRERRGVGKQNMMYTKPLDEFMNELSVISMDGFELFTLHFCGRTMRSQKTRKRKTASTTLEADPTDPVPTQARDHPSMSTAATASLPGVVEVPHSALIPDELLGEARAITTAEMEENQRFMDRMLDEVRLGVVNQEMHLQGDVDGEDKDHEQDVHMDAQTYLDENGVLNTVL